MVVNQVTAQVFKRMAVDLVRVRRLGRERIGSKGAIGGVK
jgi:hypothetical protein